MSVSLTSVCLSIAAAQSAADVSKLRSAVHVLTQTQGASLSLPPPQKNPKTITPPKNAIFHRFTQNIITLGPAWNELIYNEHLATTSRFPYIEISGGSRISPRRGRQLPRGDANIRFCHIFPKTAWNWKNLGPGGVRVPRAPLRSATGNHWHTCWKIATNSFTFCGIFISVIRHQIQVHGYIAMILLPKFVLYLKSVKEILDWGTLLGSFVPWMNQPVLKYCETT